MNKKIRWITETAIMLALLVTLQALTKGFGQLVTGSCVNAVLAVAVLVGGLGCGLTVAIVSPVLAFLLGIAAQPRTGPAIMAGNAVYVLALRLIADPTGRNPLRQAGAWLTAAVAKFAVLYLLVAKLLCPAIAYGMYWVGYFVNTATEMQPLVMGVLVSVVVGVILTLPISSAAICASRG